MSESATAEDAGRSSGITVNALSKYFSAAGRRSATPDSASAADSESDLGTAALLDITTQFPAGRITGIVGPDGAGKTTLLRVLAGLLAPTRGSVRVLGLDPHAEGATVHERVGYMPQKFGLYEDLSVQENLILYADLRAVLGAERARSFARLLSLTDLTAFTERPAGKLSGGMKQKLGLACALLGAPEVLLLDEPGVGVDPISRRELWRMVRELVGDGLTVVWSTAYLDEAELCDEVRVMDRGRISASGTPGQLIGAMRERCLQLVAVDGPRRAILQRALRQPEVIDGVIQGRHIRLVLREAGRLPALAALDAGPQAHFVAAPPRLEDAVISLMGGGPGGESALAAVMPAVQRGGETAAIEARELSKRFGTFLAADRVSFRVAPGEIFALLGPNGAGKSTTFKMECGLLKPSSGQALVMGYDLKRSPSRARQQLGYMAQKFSQYAQLSVQQNLVFFAGIYGLRGAHRQAKIAQLLEVFALQPYLQTLAGELPLGYKQRLALACAVMHEPPLLFLDEPTSGVDPLTRREFWTHINGLADKGVTVLVTTHFMDEAEYCDRIALVYHGRLIALGTPDEIKQRAATPASPHPTMEDAFIALVQDAER